MVYSFYPTVYVRFTFLDASLHLCKRVCPSICLSILPLVRWSVCPPVRLSVRPSACPPAHPSVGYASSIITQMTNRVARLGLFTVDTCLVHSFLVNTIITQFSCFTVKTCLVGTFLLEIVMTRFTSLTVETCFLSRGWLVHSYWTRFGTIEFFCWTRMSFWTSEAYFRSWKK